MWRTLLVTYSDTIVAHHRTSSTSSWPPITRRLVIYSVHNGYWFWGRPSFEDLRRDLREVTRDIRPDWDLAAPGLRENWEAGDHSMHHPYQMQTAAPMPVRNN